MEAENLPSESATNTDKDETSYKFQRLRRQIRLAIEAGELSGKLPGERILARRFNVNEKTLSKALADLATQGIIQRRVGKGTFVVAPHSNSNHYNNWLILTDNSTPPLLISELIKTNNQARCHNAHQLFKPSDIRQVDLIINASPFFPEDLYRQSAIRHIPFVNAIRNDETISCPGVILDRTLAAFDLARMLLLLGHQQIAVIEEAGHKLVSTGASLAGNRYTLQADFSSLPEDQLESQLAAGISAVICDGVESAKRISALLHPPHPPLSVQPPIALVALGECEDTPPCSGIYLKPQVHAREIIQYIQCLHPRHGLPLLLKGQYQECHSTFPLMRENNTNQLIHPR